MPYVIFLADGTCDGVECDLNSVCLPRSSGSRERKCVCKVGWTGDGQNCTGKLRKIQIFEDYLVDNYINFILTYQS